MVTIALFSTVAVLVVLLVACLRAVGWYAAALDRAIVIAGEPDSPVELIAERVRALGRPLAPELN